LKGIELGRGLISTQQTDAFNRQNRTTGISEITPKPDMRRICQNRPK